MLQPAGFGWRTAQTHSGAAVYASFRAVQENDRGWARLGAKEVVMTTRQTPGTTPAPIAATLNTPPWARAEASQGRSLESRSRTADREARTTPTRTTPPQVSAVSVPPPRRRLPMFRDPHPHSPIPARPEPPGPASAGMPPETPLLSVHASVVFLAAVIIGLVMGGLMFLPAPAASVRQRGTGGRGRRATPPTAGRPGCPRVPQRQRLEEQDQVVVAVGGAEDLVLAVAVHGGSPASRMGLPVDDDRHAGHATQRAPGRRLGESAQGVRVSRRTSPSGSARRGAGRTRPGRRGTARARLSARRRSGSRPLSSR